MKVGTKSVLFGAHCFLIHPWFVMFAWWRLYGFPWDPRLWVAFFVHDLGYLGKPNMDGPEGETHVELGAKVMSLFDYPDINFNVSTSRQSHSRGFHWHGRKPIMLKGTNDKWYELALYHSRYYAKKHCATPSRLCFADKLSFALTPSWLYLPLVNATGEINEYLKNAKKRETPHWKLVEGQKNWHAQLREYMIKWVDEHKDGRVDTWTDGSRHTINEEGAYK